MLKGGGIVTGDGRQRGHTGTSMVYLSDTVVFWKSRWQRRWEFRKAGAMRCEDETVDWVESDFKWLTRLGFAGQLERCLPKTASIWVVGMAVISLTTISSSLESLSLRGLALTDAKDFRRLER
jgi:hypothetical protein